MQIKRERLHEVRMVIFFKFLKDPSVIWLHCCLHHCKTLKAVATATVAIVWMHAYWILRGQQMAKSKDDGQNKSLLKQDTVERKRAFHTIL